jgi:hypothetical protein
VPSPPISIADSGAAWEHCIVDWHDGRYRIADRHTGAGTYVNGMRITEHSLSPATRSNQRSHSSSRNAAQHPDQLQRADPLNRPIHPRQADQPPQADQSQQASLLRACSLLFLFRALAMSQGTGHRATLEDQILRLIGDIVPSTGGAVLLETLTKTSERSVALGIDRMIGQVCREGADRSPSHTVALALYVRAWRAGHPFQRSSPPTSPTIAMPRPVATLAAAALETVRAGSASGANAPSWNASPPWIPARRRKRRHRKLVQMIARLAPQDASVLILGESGTGKELWHARCTGKTPAPEAPSPSIAPLTETLLESELGHKGRVHRRRRAEEASSKRRKGHCAG